MPSHFTCAGCQRKLVAGDRYIEDTPAGFMGKEPDEAADLMADLLGGRDGKIVYCEDCTQDGGRYVIRARGTGDAVTPPTQLTSATEVEQLRAALRFYADRRNHAGVGTGQVYRDNGRRARLTLGTCPTCTRYGDGLGNVKTGGKICDQDGCDDEYARCPDCHGAGYEGAGW